MANADRISRRNFMQRSAAMAAAVAAGATLRPGGALAARDKEMNVL